VVALFCGVREKQGREGEGRGTKREKERKGKARTQK